uniref:Uncharacterized protein n=1 Tax=Oncorhynchus mykiss TaxID=8022 RepID=A0A8K9XHT5_ONCMY
MFLVCFRGVAHSAMGLRRKDLVETGAEAAIIYSTSQKFVHTYLFEGFSLFHIPYPNCRSCQCVSVAGEAVLSLCEQACGLIDMSAHAVGHPKMGIMPRRTMQRKLEPYAYALRLSLISWVSGTSAFFFGWTINCNITIDTQDLALGRNNAMAIRGPTRGALSHNGSVEISCNVKSIKGNSPNQIGGRAVANLQYWRAAVLPHPGISYHSQGGRAGRTAGVATKSTTMEGPPPHECRGLADQPGRFWPPSDKPEHCLI